MWYFSYYVLVIKNLIALLIRYSGVCVPTLKILLYRRIYVFQTPVELCRLWSSNNCSSRICGAYIQSLWAFYAIIILIKYNQLSYKCVKEMDKNTSLLSPTTLNAFFNNGNHVAETEGLLMPEKGYIAAAVILFFIGFFGFFLNIFVIILMWRNKQVTSTEFYVWFCLLCALELL